jgi:hypothetical protein
MSGGVCDSRKPCDFPRRGEPEQGALKMRGQALSEVV